MLAITCLRLIRVKKLNRQSMCHCTHAMHEFHGKTETWQPCEALTSPHKNNDYAVIILNTPLNFSFNHHFVLDLWNQAKVRLTVDGGTQRWLTWLKTNEFEFDVVLPPNLITGDMDSLPIDIIAYFEKEHPSIQIIRTPNQDETDFTKSLRELKTYCNSHDIKLDNIYVFADTCGRFDQIMGNINTLYKCKSLLGDLKVYLIASTSLTWLLNEGHHTISIPSNLRDSQEWCALIPIGAPCRVSTQGLKWNLDKGTLQFGGMVSSSNTYNGSPNVTVQTDGCVIWSMGISTLL